MQVVLLMGRSNRFVMLGGQIYSKENLNMRKPRDFGLQSINEAVIHIVPPIWLEIEEGKHLTDVHKTPVKSHTYLSQSEEKNTS